MTFLSLVALRLAHLGSRAARGSRPLDPRRSGRFADAGRVSPQDPIQDFKMSGSDQLSVCGSTHVRDDTEAMFGIGPRTYRLFEFAAAATGVMLLAPIFLVTSIAIKLDSRGPIFIREPQFAHSNRVIQVFKFRFVTISTESSICERPTRIGRVLRGTGVDELPQFFNVLRGEMSFGDLLRAIGRDGVSLP
jgi:lipopolysaccharide/colanic/teichoic acid biosynthesis glycosyltransferase